MKKLLFLPCVITLLATTGCIVPAGGRPGYDRGYGHGHGHGRFYGRSQVIVPAPVIVVPAPVIVAPRVRVLVD